jgi:hypothetical protein
MNRMVTLRSDFVAAGRLFEPALCQKTNGGLPDRQQSRNYFGGNSRNTRVIPTPRLKIFKPFQFQFRRRAGRAAAGDDPKGAARKTTK